MVYVMLNLLSLATTETISNDDKSRNKQISGDK